MMLCYELRKCKRCGCEIFEISGSEDQHCSNDDRVGAAEAQWGLNLAAPPAWHFVNSGSQTQDSIEVCRIVDDHD
jgi:hypothetical protein